MSRLSLESPVPVGAVSGYLSCLLPVAVMLLSPRKEHAVCACVSLILNEQNPSSSESDRGVFERFDCEHNAPRLRLSLWPRSTKSKNSGAGGCGKNI